jgi:hypothetical protein
LSTLFLLSSPLCALTRRMRCVGQLRKPRSSSARLPHLIRCFGHDRLKVRGARSCGRASVFGQHVRSPAPPASFPPNKSFKPTPCRGGGHVPCATLAHVRRPATGRLNSGVRHMEKVFLRLLELLLLAIACAFLIPPYSSTPEPPKLLPGLAIAASAFLCNLALAYRRKAETLATAALKLFGFAVFGWVIYLRCVSA